MQPAAFSKPFARQWKPLLLVSLAALSIFLGKAQMPDDVLRYAFPQMGGTARNMAIAGAMGSLGGDITAGHINPAGIGLYKNSEFVLTPAFQLHNNRFDFKGDRTKANGSGLGYGTSGFVFGSQHERWRKSTSSAISLSITQLANYNNRLEYKGFNNQSTWSEQYVEELVRNEATVPQAENNFIFGSSLAFWTYLVDTIAAPNGNVIGYQSLVPLPLSAQGREGVIQHNQIETRGGAHEATLAFGNSYSDKLHLGMSFGVPFYNFRKEQTYREDDASGNTNNNFAYFEYKENYRTDGVGFNVKMGLIYRPVERLRLGFAFHTPTWASMRDQISSSITTNTENYTIFPQPLTKTSDELRGDGPAGNFSYRLSTPMRLMGSASFVINEVKDVKRQKGFITADVEYINYRGTRFSAGDPTNNDDVAYYNELNDVIRERFKGAFNLRVGGEVKFKTIMGRAGFAMLGSPFANREFRGSRILLSGGLGYRNKGYFIDLTYIHSIMQATHVPYYLQDKPSPIADGRASRGNVVLTFGVKFG
jgi:hypothetical protein